MRVIIFIAFEVSGLFAVGPIDDLFALTDFLSTSVTGTGKFGGNLSGIALVMCAHCLLPLP
jgi:hypothetical protein